MKVIPGSAAISLIWTGVKPGIFVNANVAVFHTGQGFVRFLGDASTMPAPGAAWTATGTARLQAEPGDRITDFQFGFTQFIRTARWSEFYAGRTRKEGSSAITPLSIVAGDFHNDCLPTTNPFSGSPLLGDQMRSPVLTCKTNDHPFQVFPLERTNDLTKGAGNILFHAFEKTEYWTILSLRRPDGSYLHLKHFKWELEYELKVNAWRGDLMTNVEKTINFTPAPSIVDGPPPELAASGLKMDGAETCANKKLEDAVAKIAGHKTTAAIKENDNWFSNVPANFFTP